MGSEGAIRFEYLVLVIEVSSSLPSIPRSLSDITSSDFAMLRCFEISRFQSKYSIGAILIACSIPVIAEPRLRVEQANGSEISRRVCAIGWGEGSNESQSRAEFVHTVENENADLISVVSGQSSLGAIYDDGTAVTWFPAARDEDGTPALHSVGVSDVKALVIRHGPSLALKTDNTIEALSVGLSGPPPESIGPVSSIAGGMNHFMALREDATVAAWGLASQNEDGQATVPSYLSGVVAIAAGEYHSVALKYDGSVVAWGRSPQKLVPVGLNQVQKIVAGSNGTLALKTDGSVVAWGVAPLAMMPPAELGPLKDVVLGGGVKADGTVAIWGSDHNEYLQPPLGLGEVIGIAAADKQFVAMTPRRIIRFGDVGKAVVLEKTFTIRNTGDELLNLTGVSLTALEGSGFSLETDGMALSLGPGETTTFGIDFMPADLVSSAALLTLTTNDVADPEFHFSVSGRGVNLAPVAQDVWVEIDEDSEGIDIDLLAEDPNGDPLSFWVSNYYNVVGGTLSQPVGNRVHFIPDENFNGDVSFDYEVRDVVENSRDTLGDTKRVTVRVNPVNDPPFLVVPEDQIVWATEAGGARLPLVMGAGDIEDGQIVPVLRVDGQLIPADYLFPLGITVVEMTVTDADGATLTDTFEVEIVEGPRAVLQDESGEGLRSSGQVVAWGSNAHGQTDVPYGLVDILAVSIGAEHSLALREDGTVVAWGSDGWGQTDVPVNLDEVKSITSGITNTSQVLTRAGGVVAWGSDSSGVTDVPSDLTDVVAISGSIHSLALKSDGTVVGWGTNYRRGWDVPEGLPPIRLVSAGFGLSFAVAFDGSIHAWGSGQLGDPAWFPSWLSGVTGISTFHESLAIRADRSVVFWGPTGPLEIPDGAEEAISISVGDDTYGAVRPDGTVKVWGLKSSLAIPPVGLSDVDEIACGKGSILAIRDRKERASFRMPALFGPVQRELRLVNGGTSELEVQGLYLEGGNFGDFTLDVELPDGPLAAGESVEIGVTFLPSALGVRETTLKVVTNDPLTPIRDLALTGIWENFPPSVDDLSGLELDEDSADGIEIVLPVSDANGHDISIEIVSMPDGGTLSHLVGNSLTFHPHEDFHGTTTFTYRASDGWEFGDTAEVSITVNPIEDFPKLTLPSGLLIVQTLEGAGSFVDFLVGANDPEDGWVEALVSHNGEPVKSGDFFPIGDTLVEVSATDSGGRTSMNSFIVRVVEGPDMVIGVAGGDPWMKSTGAIGWGDNDDLLLDVPADLFNPRKVALGWHHAIALQDDGTVVGWGDNSPGRNVPAGLSDVVDIAADNSGSVALKADGTVVVLGGYDPPLGLSDVVGIAMGTQHVVAVRGDGSVVSWGNNAFDATSVPADLDGVLSVAAGYGFTVALKSDGTAVSWGSGGTAFHAETEQLRGIRKIAAGHQHSMALLSDGSVVAWGTNTDGQCDVPYGLQGVKQIAAGLYHSLALTDDGQIVAWGRNDDGQISIPADLGKVRSVAGGHSQSFAVVESPSPVDVGSAAQGEIRSIPVSVRNDGNGVLEISNIEIVGGDEGDFSIQTDGLDSDLAAGESTEFQVSFSPTMNGLRSARLAITSNDTTRPFWEIDLLAHGFNGRPVASDLIGLTTEEDTPLLIDVPAVDPEEDSLTYLIRDLVPPGAGTFGEFVGNRVEFKPAANFFGDVTFVFEATDGGTISNPGLASLSVISVNDHPVIEGLPERIRVFTARADGVAVYYREPRIIDLEDGQLPATFTHSRGSIFPIGLSTVSLSGADSEGVSVTESFIVEVIQLSGTELSLETDGGVPLSRSSSVVEWSESGVTGEVPPDLRGVAILSAGKNHSFALRNDGSLVGWGDASLGQLDVPASLTDVTKISCGGNHTLALRSDGSVVAWGDDSFGQLQVPSEGPFKAVSAGGDFSLALTQGGQIVAWGRNDFGQLNVPPGLSYIRDIAAGDYHALAVKSDQTVVTWGLSTYSLSQIPRGLDDVVSVTAGSTHSSALMDDGTFTSWGWRLPLSPNLNDVVSMSSGDYFNMAMRQDGTFEIWGSYSRFGWIRRDEIPEGLTAVKSVSAGGARAAVSKDSSVLIDLGKVPEGDVVNRTVIVRNSGSETLTIGSISKLYGSSGLINHDTTGTVNSLAPNETTSFSVSFSPTSAGPQSAKFQISSNDQFESVMMLEVSAEVASKYDLWAVGVGLTGDDSDVNAVPFGDGVENLLKYAFNMDGAGADAHQLPPGGVSGLPYITKSEDAEGDSFHVEFVRRKASDLEYVAEVSDSMSPESFTPLSSTPVVTEINEDWERVIYSEPINLVQKPKLFGRVRVLVE